jgi:hypothetical protein
LLLFFKKEALPSLLSSDLIMDLKFALRVIAVPQRFKR